MVSFCLKYIQYDTNGVKLKGCLYVGKRRVKRISKTHDVFLHRFSYTCAERVNLHTKTFCSQGYFYHKMGYDMCDLNFCNILFY